MHLQTAFLFPGQGSQKPGMGEPWLNHHSWRLVEAASTATGRDVAALLIDADADTLRLTRNAQLSTFVLSMMVFDAAHEAGLTADAYAGHSLGEYTALTAAGAVDFVDASRLVAERGEAMQDAANNRSGTMAAVLGLDDELVSQACQRADAEGDGGVWVANINAPGQVVIAGDQIAVERASKHASELGAKRVIPVKVSGAFHTPLMAPAAERLATALHAATFLDTTRPVITNVDAAAHQRGAEWLDLLSRQLTGSVLWRQSLSTLESRGVRRFIELGPGSVLTATAKRTVSGAELHTINGPDDIAAVVDAVASADDATADADAAEPSLARAS
jgi:[acyl-carrier-protein] S-malonyltransferase